MKFTKRLVALVLSLVMVFGAVPSMNIKGYADGDPVNCTITIPGVYGCTITRRLWNSNGGYSDYTPGIWYQPATNGCIVPEGTKVRFWLNIVAGYEFQGWDFPDTEEFENLDPMITSFDVTLKSSCEVKFNLISLNHYTYLDDVQTPLSSITIEDLEDGKTITVKDEHDNVYNTSITDENGGTVDTFEKDTTYYLNFDTELGEDGHIFFFDGADAKEYTEFDEFVKAKIPFKIDYKKYDISYSGASLTKDSVYANDNTFTLKGLNLDNSNQNKAFVGYATANNLDAIIETPTILIPGNTTLYVLWDALKSTQEPTKENNYTMKTNISSLWDAATNIYYYWYKDGSDTPIEENVDSASILNPTSGNYKLSVEVKNRDGKLLCKNNEPFEYNVDVTSSGGSKRYKADDSDTAEKISGSGKKNSTRTITPIEGKKVLNVTAVDKKGNPIEVTQNEDGTYSYIQPASDVTINIEYAKREVALNINTTEVNANGVTTNNHVKPIKKEGSTYLPLRVVAEGLGFEVKWNANEPNIVELYRSNEETYKLYLDQYYLEYANQMMNYEKILTVENNRTFVEENALGKLLGATISTSSENPNQIIVTEE